MHRVGDRLFQGSRPMKYNIRLTVLSIRRVWAPAVPAPRLALLPGTQFFDPHLAGRVSLIDKWRERPVRVLLVFTCPEAFGHAHHDRHPELPE